MIAVYVSFDWIVTLRGGCLKNVPFLVMIAPVGNRVSTSILVPVLFFERALSFAWMIIVW